MPFDISDDIPPASISDSEAARVIERLPSDPMIAYSSEYCVVYDGSIELGDGTSPVVVPDGWDKVKATAIVMVLEDYGLDADEEMDLWRDVWAIYVRKYSQ